MAKTKSTAAKAPTTVAERRQAIRAAKGGPVSGPGLKKVEIDLTKPEARKQLTAIHPSPRVSTMLAATPADEAAAFAYIEARDEESLAKKKKEIAGNRLCSAIGDCTGILGKGWKATWDMSAGNVDWAQLAKDLNISDEVIAKYRKPSSRGLDVRELAEG